MTPFPILALAAVAGTYSFATDRLNQEFATKHPLQTEQVSYYPGGEDDLSVFALMERAAPALDATRCEPRAEMATILTVDFSERPVEKRVMGDGLHVELWGSDALGTWTIVHDGADGISCIVSTGAGWTDDTSADLIFAAAPLAS